MILSRLVDALREQNWVNVGIEVLIVVVGIVLALQFDNWNETRKERDLEQIYLSRLAEDIQGDIEGFMKLRGIFEEKYDFIEEIKSLEGPPKIQEDPQSWVRRLRFSLYVSLPTVRSATFDELASSGRLAIIQDLELRTELANYYAEYSLISRILAQPIGDWKNLVYESFPGSLLYTWRTSESISTLAEILEGYEAFRSHEGFPAAANAEAGYAGDLVLQCSAFIRRGESLQKRISTNRRDFSTL
jgi:hypothetical protein